MEVVADNHAVTHQRVIFDRPQALDMRFDRLVRQLAPIECDEEQVAPFLQLRRRPLTIHEAHSAE